ncbi:MAG: type II toxin-antitoxin system RelE/ParE family toxin [Allosphingosinicella sp.]
MKPLVPRIAAERDIDEIADHYASEAGEDVAHAFAEALQAAYRAISERPRTGSPRFSHQYHLPGLRSRRLGRFPYFVFYIERDDHIDVWRIVHAHRDISISLRPGDG